MKIFWLAFLGMIALTSCDRSDYIIQIKDVHIENVQENGGSGYIVLTDDVAANILQYGDAYVYGKYGQSPKFLPLVMGHLDEDSHLRVANGVRFRLDFSPGAAAPSNFPRFWLRNVKCLQIYADQGMIGRNGRSGWYCPPDLHGK